MSFRITERTKIRNFVDNLCNYGGESDINSNSSSRKRARSSESLRKIELSSIDYKSHSKVKWERSVIKLITIIEIIKRKIPGINTRFIHDNRAGEQSNPNSENTEEKTKKLTCILEFP